MTGVDLSEEMVAAPGPAAPGSATGPVSSAVALSTVTGGPFDATISRYVLHHVADPAAFVRRQVELIRPGGLVVLSDHTTDPDPTLADRHNAIERLRDRTHTRNLSPGTIVDLLASAGLGEIRLVEEAFTLDFDEWFDRGTPAAPKDEVRARSSIAADPRVPGGRSSPPGQVTIHCWRAIVRGRKSVEGDGRPAEIFVGPIGESLWK